MRVDDAVDETFERLRLPPAHEAQVWELFHENSKQGRFDAPVSEDAAAERTASLRESLEYAGYPIVDLGEPRRMDMSLTTALAGRVTCREMGTRAIERDELAALLHAGYGVNRTAEETRAGRGFRTVPSAGGLFPLELYVAARAVTGLEAALYHYNPTNNRLRRIGDATRLPVLIESMVYPEPVGNAAALVIMSGLFGRTTFKYGDRGYRFALLEAGHVAQNINLAAVALGLGSMDVGGYFDRTLDAGLGFDGVNQSAIYAVAVGHPN